MTAASYPQLETGFLGFRLASPIIAGSSGLTGRVSFVEQAAKAGAEAVILKSVSDVEAMHRSPSPRYQLLTRTGKSPHRIFYSYEQAYFGGIDDYAGFVGKLKTRVGIPIIASVLCLTKSNWAPYLQAVEQAGADAVEINVSCPHGSLSTTSDAVEQAILTAARACRPATKLPLILKLTPQLGQPLHMIQSAMEIGFNAVTMFNRFPGLELDLDTGRPVMHGGYAGHGGSYALHYVMRWLCEARRAFPETPISASGGVWDWQGAAKLLLCGATTVQVCSALYFEGMSLIAKLNRGLARYLDEQGVTLDELRGRAARQIIGLHDVDRATVHPAVIDPSACVNCGRCVAACPREAIEAGETHPTVTGECDGCGFCVLVCAVNAINLT